MQSPITPLSTGNLPVDYRVTTGWKIFSILSAVLFFGASSAPLWAGDQNTNIGRALFLLMCLCFSAAAIYFLLLAFRSRIILYPDRLENIGPIKTTVALRDEIKGWRIVTSTTPSILILELSGSSPRKMNIGLIFRFDDLFAEWLGDSPDLDQEERDAALLDILGDDQIGNTQEERIDSLAASAGTARALNIIAIVLILLGCFYPRPYILVTSALMLLPLIAIVIVGRSRGLIRIDSRKTDPHPSVGFVIFGASSALMLRGVLDSDALFCPQVILWPAIITVLVGIAAFIADRSAREQKGSFAGLVIFLAVYGYGATAVLNTFADAAPLDRYDARILQMKTVHGKSDRYELTLSPWGPKRAPNTIDVSSQTYDRIREGQVVPVIVRHGLLHIPWYYVLPKN